MKHVAMFSSAFSSASVLSAPGSDAARGERRQISQDEHWVAFFSFFG
jgi:hypothetical protein